LHRFRALVAAEGLSVNESKTDVVNAAKWTTQVQSRDAAESSDSFGTLMRRMQVYLARSPNSYGEIHRLFRESGFSLPFSRLRSAAGYGRFQRFLKWALRRTKDWNQWFMHLFESPKTLLTSAIEVRGQLLDSAKRVAEAAI